jgi:hypothetical protein
LVGEDAKGETAGGTAVGPLGVVPQAVATTIAPVAAYRRRRSWIDELIRMCHHLIEEL